jgi:hypothetical protein
MWLYKDFPDVELFVWHSDKPGKCHLHVPFILDTHIHQEVVTQPGSQGFVGGVPVSIPYLYSDSDPSAPRARYTHGYTIPPWAIWHLAVMPAELQLQHLKQLQRSQRDYPALKPQVIWRGADTGGLTGWQVGHSHNLPYRDPWAQFLFNKRNFITRLARRKPGMLDVGISNSEWPRELFCTLWQHTHACLMGCWCRPMAMVR